MKELRLIISPTKENLKEIDCQMKDSLAGYEKDHARAFHFAMHELVINSIQAGERAGVVKDFEVGINHYKGNVVKGYVKDYFGGIDEDAVKKEGCLFSESGRGFLLIDHIVDQMTLRKEDDGSFTVTISKTMDPVS